MSKLWTVFANLSLKRNHISDEIMRPDANSACAFMPLVQTFTRISVENDEIVNEMKYICTEARKATRERYRQAHKEKTGCRKIKLPGKLSPENYIKVKEKIVQSYQVN